MTAAFRPPASDVTAPAPATPELEGVAVGCDVVEVARIARLLARRPAARDTLFTQIEQADAVRDGVGPDDPTALRRLAARFAAKEAVVKLLRRPALAWIDVEVRTHGDGAPQLWIHGQRSDIAISLSHDGDVAMAVVARTTPTTPSSPTTVRN
ncbi:MAG: 4'-phosphopantetheinyl transferase superfamily protein [Actinobacteria bacterium]|nr:4'-phosphopantetheinyl transferase superfamily protein [Actinomycetota bacterium]